MFIQTQDTPNPNTVKFVLPNPILESGSYSLTRGSDALAFFPVARKLFEIEEILSLMISQDFISVTKNDDTSWDALKTMVLSSIIDMTSSKMTLVELSKLNSEHASKAHSSDIDTSIAKQINELIETKVRPAVAQDGGDIVFDHFSEGVVYLKLHGACSNCPSSTITLKNGIENMLKHYIPEVDSVEAI